jgi:hypothetical protein
MQLLKSYRLESVYLSANSTYADARTFGIKAALIFTELLQLKQSLQQMHFMQ